MMIRRIPSVPGLMAEKLKKALQKNKARIMILAERLSLNFLLSLTSLSPTEVPQ